jgi:hypothetical protein
MTTNNTISDTISSSVDTNNQNIATIDPTGHTTVATMSALAGPSIVRRDKITHIDDSVFSYASTEDSDLSKFLSRPIELQSSQWTVGGTFSYDFDPWAYWLTDPTIAEKLRNYYLFRGDIHVTVRINGSPFHYGRLLMAYQPFSDSKTKYDLAPYLPNPDNVMIYGLSQSDPVMYIDPGRQTEICMKCPYFNYNDYMNLFTNSSQLSLGRVYIYSLGPLSIANSSASTTLDITVFLHAENVTLSVPTTWEFQAGDEFEANGVLSRPLLAASNLAAKFKDVPGISKFANAGEIATRAMSNIAEIFGYSRPVDVRDNTQMKRVVYDKNANTTGLSTIEKLSLDQKCEVAVTGESVGLKTELDEMSISHIAGRETLITTIDWASSDVAGGTLGSVIVSPTYSYVTSRSGYDPVMLPSSLCFASLPFKYWGGSIKFRFSIIASQYHRGKIRIAYDPYGQGISSSYNKQYNVLLDIESLSDYVMTISMVQPTPYLLVKDPTELCINTPANYDRKYHNGIFYISVVNELSSPESSSDVSILVYASAGDDFTVYGFKDPRDPNWSLTHLTGKDNTYNSGNGWNKVYSYTNASLYNEFNYLLNKFDNGFQFQGFDDPNSSGAINSNTVIHNFVGKPNPSFYSSRTMINYADPIVSMRNPIKRWQRQETVRSVYSSLTSSNDYYIAEVTRLNFPQLGGQCRSGDGYIDYAGSVPGIGSPTSLIAYLGLAYAGWKGGLRWRYLNSHAANAGTGETQSYMYVTRASTVPSTDSTTWSTSLNGLGGIETFANDGQTAQFLPSSLEGMSLTDTRNQNCVEVEFPYYNYCKFCVLGPQGTDASLEDGSAQQVHRFYIINQHPATVDGGDSYGYESYVAAGDDFNLFWYTGAPIFGLMPYS